MEFKKSYDLVDYQGALTLMEERVDHLRHDPATQELVWFLEHPPLYTAGTSAKADDLLDDRFPVFETGRGGQYTYHGPGQRVAYLMLDLKQRQAQPDIKHYVWQLEEVIIRTLSDLGIEGHRREGRVGIWVVDGSKEDKVAAIGVRVRHWVTFHGLSINNTPDLSHFDGIVPCGIQEHGVTSLEKLGVSIDMKDLDDLLVNNIQGVFGDVENGSQAAAV